MRYLELLVTDIPDTDAPTVEPFTRTEWIHRDHIETIEPYTLPDHGQLMLWLELTLTSGRTRYLPLCPVHPDHVADIARHAVATLVDTDQHPIRAATLTRPDTPPPCREAGKR